MFRPHSSRFSQSTHCYSYPCFSVCNPLQHPAATLGFTLFLCLWFPETLIHVGVWGNGGFSPAWCFLSCLIYGSLVFILHFEKFLAIVTSSIFFCSIHLSFFFWCTNYSCITSFDIIPHFLNDLFCFIYHDYLFIYFLHTLVWEVSVVLSSSLLIFSLGYLKFIDETMKAFFIVAIVFLISTISFRFSLSISISFVCCLLFFH